MLQALTGLRHLTSSILLAEVGEPPDVAQSHTEAEDGEEELDWTVPGDPGGGVAALALHVLLHLVHLLELNHSAETRQHERLDVRKKQEKMNGNFREW